MQIRLYTCIAENNRVDKSNYLTNSFIMEGALRGDSSIIDPIILIEKSNPASMNYNYMYIGSFNRYYYINDIISTRNNLWEIHAHVDVLYTWGASIKKSKFVIDKSEQPNDANLYLDDGSFVTDSRKFNTIKNFDQGLDQNGQYILICAGGGSGNGSSN